MSSDRMKVIFSHVNGKQELRITVNAGEAPTQPQYRYSRDGGKLTPSQREFYEHNGFLVVPNLVAHDLLDGYKERFLDLVEGRANTAGMTKMKDVTLKSVKGVSGERTVNKIQDFVWDECLGSYCLLPQVLDYVESFVGQNIMSMHTMLINKPPDPGTQTSRHPMHQDLHYFPFRPADRIVCAWTAMERVDVDNGCLFVVPGSHKLQLMQHDYPEWLDGVNKMYHGVRGYDDHPKTLVEMEKGDTVFFHPILLHGSGTNSTQRFRKAISTHYAASECEYIDVRGTTQENIAKEVEEIARRRGATGLDFKDIWSFRSRLSRGEKVNL